MKHEEQDITSASYSLSLAEYNELNSDSTINQVIFLHILHLTQCILALNIIGMF